MPGATPGGILIIAWERENLVPALEWGGFSMCKDVQVHSGKRSFSGREKQLQPKPRNILPATCGCWQLTKGSVN